MKQMGPHRYMGVFNATYFITYSNENREEAAEEDESLEEVRVHDRLDATL